MGLKKISAKEKELYIEIETFLNKLFAEYYILICLSSCMSYMGRSNNPCWNLSPLKVAGILALISMVSCLLSFP